MLFTSEKLPRVGSRDIVGRRAVLNVILLKYIYGSGALGAVIVIVDTAGLQIGAHRKSRAVCALRQGYGKTVAGVGVVGLNKALL